MLSADDWRRLEALFHRACALPPSEREAFVRAEAGEEPELLHELRVMLAAESGATERLRAPLRDAAGTLARMERTLPPGTRLGPWAVERLIGAGGMGRVYLGHRADGRYDRQVAIKVIAASLADARQRGFFDFECRLLAQMQHPAIAQIHDAGTDGEGRPYLVMEYVEGRPIVEWCAQRDLPLRARVELLVRVCEGVQHAHQKGVIHRDLKPSNVLVGEVDGRGLPRIIDFGIAIEVDREGEAGTSEQGGTPGYMSPEQEPGGAGADARSDVYSLGALLRELLVGDARRGDGEEPPSARLRRMPPAARLAIAQQCGCTPRRLLRALDDGLDWIVLKAMQRERSARYDGVSSLLDDLRRWLDGHVPVAAPRDRLRTLRRFVGRHRGAVAAACLLAATLLGGLGVAGWSLGRAASEAERARATADFLASLLRSADPDIAGELDKTLLLRVLDDASARAGDELGRHPGARAEVELTIGVALVGLGEYERAMPHLETVQQLAAAHPRRLVSEDLKARQVLGEALILSGRPEEGETVLRDALAASTRHEGPHAVLTYELRSRLALALRERGRIHEALAESQVAFDGLGALVEHDDPWLIDAGARHAINLGDAGRYDEAIDLIRDLIARRSARLGEDHALTLALRNSLAVFLLQKRDYAAAEVELRTLLDASIRVFGEQARAVLIAHSNLAGALRKQGKVAEAGPHYRMAMEGMIARHGADSVFGIVTTGNHANWLLDDGQAERAFEAHTRAFETARRVLDAPHPVLAETQRALAESSLAVGRLDEALAHARDALAMRRALHGEVEGPLASARETLARVEAALADGRDAAPETR